MASHDVTADQASSATPLDRYLADLAARLRGPRTARARVLAEVRDGLLDMIDTHLAGGGTPDAAADAAIDEFGAPASIADAFAGELATASARRTVTAFLVTGPLVGIWWLLLLHPSPWRSSLFGLLVAIPALPLVVLAIVTAAATFATTGRLMRWLPEMTGASALVAATIIATLCLGADLTVLVTLAVHMATGWHGPVGLIAVAATASIVRIAAATAAIRSIRATRERSGPA